MPVITSPIYQRQDIRSPGWFETFGTNALTSASDVLLQALLSGQLGRVPTQGSYTAPSGQGTRLSPAEVSSRNPNVSLSSLLKQNAPMGSSVKMAGSPFRFLPPLTRDLQQAQLQQSQMELAQGPEKLANLKAETAQRQSQAALNRTVAGLGGLVTIDNTGNVVPSDPSDPTQRQFRMSKNGLVPIPPSLDQKARQEERIAKQKKRREISENLKRLNRAEEQIVQLYQRAEKEVPPISGEGLVVPLQQGLRSIQTVTGFAEKQRGFQDTYPIQAREQLQELEKGGRYTNQDVDQIIKGTAPQYGESATRRAAKRKELIDRFRSERNLYQKELDSLTDEVGVEEPQLEDFSQYSDEELQSIISGK